MSAESSREPVEAERKLIFKISIDKNPYELPDPNPSGMDLLKLASKVPVEQYGIYIKRKGSQPERIKLEEKVDLTAPGVEHFVTLPLDQTEG